MNLVLSLFWCFPCFVFRRFIFIFEFHVCLFIYLVDGYIYHTILEILIVLISVMCYTLHIQCNKPKGFKKKVKVKKEKVKVDPSVAVQRNVHNVVSLQFTWGKMTKLNEGLLSLLWLLWSIWHPDVCRSRSRGKFGNQDLYVNLFFLFVTLKKDFKIILNYVEKYTF